MTQQEPTHFLHRDLSTQNQLGMLLAVCQTTMQYLADGSAEAENIPGSRPLPGESRIAAETTLIKACGRIDAIFDEPLRWDLDYQISLEKLFVENTELQRKATAAQVAAHQAETKKAEAQHRAALEVQSPHFIHRPPLAKQEDGSWAAYIGDPKDPDACIIGLRITPDQAQRAFDTAFSGTLPEIQQQIEKEILNEDNTVDPSGSRETETTDEGGQDRPPVL